jgi:putative pyruvate formate lyase activating enzyme
VISGTKGICNIFFFHCNLQCIYCQNFQISRNKVETFHRDLQSVLKTINGFLDQGVPSVGFVSPSHMAGQVREIIEGIRQHGRKPVYVWNSNGYDRVKTLQSFEDQIDVYLPDFKYADAGLGAAFSGVDNYPEIAVKAIKEMVRQKGTSIVLNDDGIIETGVIVRHLILPGHVENSKDCLRILAEEVSPAVYVSLMSQYHPVPGIKGHPELNRTLTHDEYKEVLEEYYRLGFYRGWTQELISEATYNPDFSSENPFPDLI